AGGAEVHERLAAAGRVTLRGDDVPDVHAGGRGAVLDVVAVDGGEDGVALAAGDGELDDELGGQEPRGGVGLRQAGGVRPGRGGDVGDEQGGEAVRAHRDDVTGGTHGGLEGEGDAGVDLPELDVLHAVLLRSPL